MKRRQPTCPLTAPRGAAGIGLRRRSAPQVNPMTATLAVVRVGGARDRI